MGICLDLAVLLRININCDMGSVCVHVPLHIQGEMMQGVNCCLVCTEQ